MGQLVLLSLGVTVTEVGSVHQYATHVGGVCQSVCMSASPSVCLSVCMYVTKSIGIVSDVFECFTATHSDFPKIDKNILVYRPKSK